MLETVLNYLNNYFIKEIVGGTFEIVDGTLTIPKAIEGQYIRIRGSALNDGLYKYPAQNLKNETFEGIVDLLAIPQHLLDVVEKITEYSEKYPVTPYSSESFGGYSYTKAGNSSGDASASWQQAFKSELRRYKKII